MATEKMKCLVCNGLGKKKETYVATNQTVWKDCHICRGTGLVPKSEGNCFVATATYGSPIAPEVMFLRRFRDNILLTSKVGEIIVMIYYYVSPSLARLITKFPLLKLAVRNLFLSPILRFLKAIFKGD